MAKTVGADNAAAPQPRENFRQKRRRWVKKFGKRLIRTLAAFLGLSLIHI